MKLTKCENGHFFDMEKYSACPHCKENERRAPGKRDNAFLKDSAIFGDDAFLKEDVFSGRDVHLQEDEIFNENSLEYEDPALTATPQSSVRKVYLAEGSAEMTAVSTSADSVQIYKNSAVVTRRGSVDIYEGRNRMKISGLTNTAVLNTMRLQFPAGILAENIDIVSQAGEGDAPYRALEDEVQACRDRISFLKTEMELLQKNGIFTERKEFDEEQIIHYLTELPDRLGRISREIREQEKDLALKSAALEKAGKDAARPYIIAELQSEKEIAGCPFTLQYQERAASWSLRYEVHYEGSAGAAADEGTGEKNGQAQADSLTVRMKAKIAQRTGENWEKVKVTLFTGNPVLVNMMPVLQTMKVGLWSGGQAVTYTKYEPSALRSPGPRTKASLGMADMEDAAMEFAAALPEPSIPLRTAPSEASALETMDSYALPARKSIYTDSEGNISDLQMYTIKASIKRIIYPGYGHFAWLAAEIPVESWPMPDASAAVYLNNVYAGEMHISPDRSKETFLLSLGADERIGVSREKITDQITERFIGSRKTKTVTYRITVSSTLTERAELEIREQIPVSTDKAVAVETTDLGDGTVEADTGAVIWRCSAEPGEKVVRTLSYSISWPKDSRLSGKGF